ncbi:exostosin family protein [Oceanihabitans sediminis]|uniref:exostosin domain-containing protein n=1 Tax=Oceanihabitans sediminis TaxID=1812012 RepID=UPI00299DC7DC|nr:exostosin family protein [Oceanihabitans sediminis]MDX1774843.1 exostosin family protein [Oceanihabitans sediminis]
MKLYYPLLHYDATYRGMVFPLLKPFIKGADFTDAQRIEVYGVSEQDFAFTDRMEAADLVILTMAWNYYVKTKQENLTVSFIEECGRLHKKVLVVNVGDFGVKIPSFKTIIHLRSGGYKSKFKHYEFCIPPFIEDPLKKYFSSDQVFLRPYQKQAVVGFCGQANASRVNAFKEVVKTIGRNLKYYLRLSNEDPQQILSTSYLRASILNFLQKSDGVVCNFILRKKYRAGVTSNKDFHDTTLAFYNNLRDSDYIVCVRGAGNFSVRFYEALAMGRIPVFINTDCALPLDNIIPWKKHVVWVEFEERDRVAEKVKQFHEALSKKDFIDLQRTNRKLWEDTLTLPGFFMSFIPTLK